MGDRQEWRTVALGIVIGLMTTEDPALYGAEPSNHSSIDRIAPSAVADTRPPSLRKNPVSDGIVERYLIDPRGEVEGLLLTDGTQMHVTSRASDQLIKAIKPGDHVRVHGSRKQGGALVNPDVIVNVTAGSSFTVPFRIDLSAPEKERRLSMTEMEAKGTIQVLLYDYLKGVVHGMVLSDGTQVRLPPDVSDELRRSFHVGEHVAAEGNGTKNEYGRSMEALAMSADDGTLTPLDPTVRRLR